MYGSFKAPYNKVFTVKNITGGEGGIMKNVAGIKGFLEKILNISL